MLLFCPSCANVLTVSRLPPTEEDPGRPGPNRFECRTCPYEFKIEGDYFEKTRFKPKKAEDILDGQESLQMQEKADIRCKDPNCSSQEAYVRQVQIRSADEGMTSFYTCCKCLRKWQDN